MRIAIAAACLMAVCSCSRSRGHDYGTLRAQIAVDSRAVTDEEIAAVLTLEPQLDAPFKLGVYFMPPKVDESLPQWMRATPGWGWTSLDKDSVLAMKPELIRRGVLSDMFLISDGLVEGRTPKAVRLAAARMGADAALVINGISDTDRYNNFLGPLYMFIVTMLFVPGSEIDGLVLLHAAMWDVRNEFLYLTAESEGTASQTRPESFVKAEPVLEAAKRESLNALNREIVAHLCKLADE